jgi:hypothetical protein
MCIGFTLLSILQACVLCVGETASASDSPPTSDAHTPHVPQEGEPDFVETVCHWADCTLEFDTQDDLVKVHGASNSANNRYYSLFSQCRLLTVSIYLWLCRMYVS